MVKFNMLSKNPKSHSYDVEVLETDNGFLTINGTYIFRLTMAVRIILERNVTIEDFQALIAVYNRENIEIQVGNNTVFNDLVTEMSWEYILFECPYREVSD